jgi:hypothetical protein
MRGAPTRTWSPEFPERLSAIRREGQFNASSESGQADKVIFRRSNYRIIRKRGRIAVWHDSDMRQLVCSLSVTGSVLLFMTILLIVIGACCLDWMEKDESGIGSNNARHEYEDDDDQ